MTLDLPQRHAPRHPKYDAIHRALLTGLISNIGTKSDTYEYLGTRSTRYSIFPGSALFSQKPKWLMSAELVETTKLYARINASVQPQWIERAAAHLVERTYSEPRYEPKTASVVASEKVTLYGLVLIAARPVHYGPINPKLSRELFIHHALVLELLHTDAPFFRFNNALVKEVELLEAKIRQRNLLADISTRFAFYDARLPQTITNGAQLDSWRRVAERDNPRILYMNKEDLLRADAPPITPENYPDRMTIEKGNLHLPLTYKFEPTEPTDGLTLTVPLAALTQLHPEQYEWLVPGMLEDKIAALIRALPGNLRRSFVPVPDWSRAAAAALSSEFRVQNSESSASPHPSQKPAAPHSEFRTLNSEFPSLRDALATFLSRQTGAPISGSDFVETALPDHLRMNFKVVDDSGKVLSLGRDLPIIQRKLAPQAAGTFAQIYQKEFHRDGITSWEQSTIGDLPDSLAVQRFQMTITAFPALVDQGDSCSLRLFPSRKAADESHRAGIRRLFRLEFRKDLKYITHHLPHFEQMSLHFISLGGKGKSEELREQLITLLVDRALFAPFNSAPPAPPRTLAAWQELSRLAAIRLLDTADTVCNMAANLLAEVHAIRLILEEAGSSKLEVGRPNVKLPTLNFHLPSSPHQLPTSNFQLPTSTLTDIHDQMAYLLPPQFLTKTPWTWLEHFPRYLAGIRIRLEKLRAPPASPAINTPGRRAALDRDAHYMAELAPLWHQYLLRRDAHQKLALDDPELDLYRWMLEEYRLSLFAQELGTSFTISPRRLEKQWEKVRK